MSHHPLTQSAAALDFHPGSADPPAASPSFATHASPPAAKIPFDDRGQMEVDFLCADARLVIELDGAQHLADALTA